MTRFRLVDLAGPLRESFDLAGLITYFPDRWGGVSEPPFATLNLGFSTGDDPTAVLQNRRRLVEAAEVPIEQLVVAGQIHGAEVARLQRSDGGEGATGPSRRLAGKDVIVLEEPGVFALSLAADCALVAIADPGSRRAGVAHCGWRGTVAGAVGRLIEAIEPGSEAIAVISPAISGQHYPVGNDVIEAIQAIPGGEKEGQDGHLDLRNVLVEQLIRGGFTTDRMAVDRRCNASDPDLFSHRGEGGTTGRGGLLIGWNL